MKTNETGKATETIRAILQNMSLAEKVGQLFIVRCPRTGVSELIQNYHVGGITLYDADFEDSSPDEVKATIASYQAQAKIPLFIAVDEEGGRVCRISNHKQFRATPFPYPQELVAGGIDAIRQDATEKAALLTSLGVTLDFAPVCDLSQNPDSFIYCRTYGKGPEETGTYIRAVVEAMNRGQLLSTLKHFPGYGDNMDTHVMSSSDARDMDTFVTSELIPFIAGIEAGADMVMISHNIIECMEPDCPASLSPAVHRLLREKLAFRGVIATDSLDMDAVTLYTNNESAAVRAILSGNDLLCCSSYKEQIPAVLQAVSDGTIEESRIDASLERLLLAKAKFGQI